MTMTAERWEHGSEFHRLDASPPGLDFRAPPWVGGHRLGSGRDALRLVVRHGLAGRGWRRLWVPGFLCQEVVAALAGEGLALGAYFDLPGRPLALPPATRGEAVLVVNTFGLRAGPTPSLPPGVDIVEDHTHDPTSPWAAGSRADFAVASLRKTLPVPEGGVLWSPKGHPLPAAPPVTEVRRAAAAAKREAMTLKRSYLAGEVVEKESFRSLALAGEEGIASGEISSMTAETADELSAFPLERWRAARARNWGFLAGRLSRLGWLRVLEPESSACAGSSVVVLVDDPARRDRVRTRLIERRVYPAVLWPLEATVVPVPLEARALSRRVLSLHCDVRYGESDLSRVADLVEEAGTP